MQSAEQKLDQEADELWKEVYSPDEPEVEAQADSEAKVTDEPEVEVKAEPETKEPPKTEESLEADPDDSQDELDGLSVSNAEERIKNARARMTRATQEAADLRKKVEPLEASNTELKESNTKLHSELQAIKQQLEQLQSSAPPEKTDSPQAVDAELQTAMEDYPEVVGPLSRQNEQLAQQNQELAKRLDQLEGRVTKTSEGMEEDRRLTAVDEWKAAVQAVHEDADEIVQSQDFDGWMSRQPKAIQQIAQESTAKDFNWMLDQYKAAVGQPSNKLEAARDAATATTPRARNQPTQGKPHFTRAMINAMTPEQFQKNEAAIDEALSRGEIY